MLQTVYSTIRINQGHQYGGEASEYQSEIIPGKSIRITADKDRWDTNIHGLAKVHYDVTFNLGDQAEYDSYNFIYYGKITKITEKQVWIEAHGRTHRLDIHGFCSRNWDFNLQRAADNNTSTSYYI